MARITDKSFVYTPSYDTDLRKKFRMIMEQQRKTESSRRGKSPQPLKSVGPLSSNERIAANGAM